MRKTMYKTILVHVDDTAHSAQRTAVAATMARASAAHVVGAATTGLPVYVYPGDGLVAGLPVPESALEELRVQAERALDRFEAAAREAGVASVERMRIDEEAGIALAMQSRYCDLAIISQASPDEFLPRQRADVPDYIVLNSARPVLVLPAVSARPDIGQRVVLAWNGSKEAARAIASALPLLQAARQVDLVIFDPERSEALHGREPGADMARYLARHGVTAEVSVARAGRHDGDALLTFASDKAADLIVMGAYGRSRFREIMLGGMTRAVLASSPIALWMAH
jgi:nucleotide-binding universal stress UspA family protein